MARFPESAKPFLDDLIGPIANGQPAPNLSPPAAETVCRILLSMPDIENWRRNALEILPYYRRAAESILLEDLHGSDQEKSYQARRWLADLKSDVPGIANEQPSPRRRSTPSTTPSLTPRPAVDDSTPIGDPAPRATPPPAPRPLPIPAAYSGAKSGTLECSGAPVPQNAEYVFRSVPPVKMQLDYDTKIWDARLAPGDGGTQRVILRNKSSGPQKHCVVHWSVIP